MKAGSQTGPIRHAFGFALSCILLLGTLEHARALTAVNDMANTVQNVPVTIPVLANDSDDSTNQVAILNVTTPAHGSVSINSNALVLNAELARLLQFAGGQLSNTVKQLGSTNLYPRSTLTNGLWKTTQASDWGNGWVNGFFPGALWYMYELTGDTHFQGWAQQWTAPLAPDQYVTNTDDVGFILNTSFGNGYRVTGNTNYLSVEIQAAQSLSNRFNTVVGCVADDLLLSPPDFQVILDTLMNTELLYRGAALSGDTNLYKMALSHANKAMLNQIRTDGSTWQEVIYNLFTGAVISQGQREGYSNTSTWARGQAWGIYGFTMACQQTTSFSFLAAAQECANYYLANVPADFVPYWDFDAPGIPNAPRDSSAAAITLSGLVQMSLLATNLSDSASDWLGARHILSSLGSTNYLAQGTSSSGILLHGTGEPPQNIDPEIDVSLIYGDYYFIEALYRYAQIYGRTTVTYTPNPGFQGTDTFIYQACDSAGNCSTAAVTVVVQPLLPTPFPVQISLLAPRNTPALSFSSAAGRSYFVQYLDDVAGGAAWSTLATNVAGTGSSLVVTDTNTTSRRFYRVGVH